MAHENVNLKYPNFCLGPVLGTLCTIDMTSVTTVLRIKNEAGAFIKDYTLSSNIVDELIMLEYVGPVHLTTVLDGATFFTLEKISSSKCVIKRWEIKESTATLNLKQQFVKTSAGDYYYDVLSMAVEHYRRKFDDHNEGGINYLEINSANRITTGTRLFLGPSHDTDNIGAGEYVTVSHVVDNKVYLNSNIKYQYIKNDYICFYTDMYLFSAIATGGDTTRGSIFKLDVYTGSVKQISSDGIYQKVSGSRWCLNTTTIANICGANLLFVDPYAYYLNKISIFLNNVTANGVDIFPIYDIVFDGGVVYKLAQGATWRDDEGNRTTSVWQESGEPRYNWQKATLVPHVNTLELYALNSKMFGEFDETTIFIKVTDQFGVGLRDVIVVLSVSDGDGNAEFDPLNGEATTDINGEAFVGYRSGHDYDGLTLIKGYIQSGGSTFTGSAYVWNSIYITSDVTYPPGATLPSDPEDEIILYTLMFQKEKEYFHYRLETIASGVEVEFLTFNRTYFTTPGGDWINPSPNAGSVAVYLPMLVVGEDDGPQEGFSTISPLPIPQGLYPMPNRITQVLDFESENINMVRQLGNFCSMWYSGDWREPYICVDLKEEKGELQLSQLKLSKHTYWLGGGAYDYLWTYVNMDQFVFVALAVPAFYSVKNPIDTNIWLRLRPSVRQGYASSLDISTLRFLVREVSYAGDTGYVDVTSQIVTTAFEAMPGLMGYELDYDPIQDFHHSAIVFVHIEIWDTYEEGGVPCPNRICIDYWFLVIPDYKFPYLENLNPSREQDMVPVNTSIYFEIKDKGAGVDIDTLELFINSRYVTPTDIVKVNDNHYKVTYVPAENFYYDKEITVAVKVSDRFSAEEQHRVTVDGVVNAPASGANMLWDSYRFYTVEGADIVFTNFDPAICKRGMPRFSNVSFAALGWGAGIDKETLRVQIYGYYVTNESKILPIVYRTS